MLDPILFNVYIDGILSILDYERPVFFADDPVVIVQGGTE